MILTIILIIIYLFSIIKLWNYTKIAYSIGGVLENREITLFDIVFIFIPIINTILAFNMGEPDSAKNDIIVMKRMAKSKQKENKPLLFNQIFGIKKKTKL